MSNSSLSELLAHRDALGREMAQLQQQMEALETQLDTWDVGQPLNLLLSPHELDHLRDVASQHGLTVAQFVRHALLAIMMRCED